MRKYVEVPGGRVLLVGEENRSAERKYRAGSELEISVRTDRTCIKK